MGAQSSIYYGSVCLQDSSVRKRCDHQTAERANYTSALTGANAPKQLEIGLGVQARLDVKLDDMDERQLGGYMGELMKVTGMLLESTNERGIIDVEYVD